MFPYLIITDANRTQFEGTRPGPGRLATGAGKIPPPLASFADRSR